MKTIQAPAGVRVLFSIAFLSCGLLMLSAGVLGAGALPGPLYTFDARPLNRLDLSVSPNAARLWDTMHVISALQGLANRHEPRFYLFYCQGFGVDTDQFWFDWFRAEDGWLRGAQVRPLASLEEAIGVFRKSFKGLAVYDPLVEATSNLASTAAGCEDLLPVRYDPSPGSVFTLLTRKLHLPVRLWLLHEDGTSLFTGKGELPVTHVASAGRPKVDAYKWAIARYLENGHCAPGVAAYYIDSFWLKHPRQAGPDLHTLSNHDYFIARRAFFFDLSPWADEAPNDDPGQPLGLDRAAFLEVMHALYKRNRGSIIQVGGFIPWPHKYTSHSPPPGGKHEGVPTEWEFGRLISQFNGYMEADAAGLSGMANASFYRHYPLASKYRQPNPKPRLKDLRSRGFLDDQGRVVKKFFVGHYVGDYDAPSWLYKAVPGFFKDPARGRVPLGWAFDPNLADRAPQALVYAYRHATSNDFFITGDSGAGYLNPRGLTVRPESKLPSGLEAWVRHCRKYYSRWDMTITGFVLDGSSGASTDLEFQAYKRFSPDGAGTHFEKGPAILGGIPTCPERDLPDSAEAAAKVIAKLAQAQQGKPGFLWARSILKPPAWYLEVSSLLKEKHPEAQVEVVDPYTFFMLIRCHSG